MTHDSLVELTLNHIRNLNGLVIISILIALMVGFSNIKKNYWFVIMMFSWSAINYLIGLWSKYQIGIQTFESVDAHFSYLKNILIINILLGILYFAISYFLHPKGKEVKRATMRSQFSQAIVIQAFGLLSLDIAFLLKLLAPVAV